MQFAHSCKQVFPGFLVDHHFKRGIFLCDLSQNFNELGRSFIGFASTATVTTGSLTCLSAFIANGVMLLSGDAVEPTIASEDLSSDMFPALS